MHDARPDSWPAGYVRKSLVRTRTDEISPERQREAVSAVAADRGVAGELRWYVDASGHRSGRHEHTRPDYLRLKRDLQAGRIHTVIVYDQDRASRSVRDTAELVDLCKRQNIRLILINNRFDSARDGWGADAVARINMDAVYAQRESDKSAERMSAHIEHVKSKRVYWGTTPYGALRSGKGLQARMVPGKRAADVRSALEAWIAPGASYATAAAALNEQGVRYWKSVKLPNDDRVDVPADWDADRVRQLVCNILFYAGYVLPRGGRAKRRAVKLDGAGTLLEQYARAYAGELTEMIEPIADATLAERVVAKRFSRAAKGGRRPNPEWFPLLMSLLWFQGQALRSQNAHGCHYYATRGRVVGASGTGRMSWHAEAIERELVERLQGVRFPEVVLDQIRQLVAERHGGDAKATALRDLHEAQERLAALREMRIEHRLQQVRAGRAWTVEDDAVYVEKLQIEERRMFEAKRVINAVSDLDTAVAALQDLGASLMRLAPKQRNLAMQAMFEKMEINQAGEITQIVPKAWARAAFGELVWAWKLVLPTMTPTGVGRKHGNSLRDAAWLLDRIAA
jgi:DNA invertase Pin-like site-specific DNA recombinase